MSKVLGLDLGTNSIGWAVVDMEKKNIIAAGSRVVPMDQSKLNDFEKGKSVSLTAERTQKRGARRLYERFHLRRERLLKVLRVMNFLPEHYASQLSRHGALPPDSELKLAWRKGEAGKQEFLFKSSFEEMVMDFRNHGYNQPVPYDWTIYYLRKKALHSPLSKEELAWVLLQFNQKRGYNQLRSKLDDLEDESAVAKEEREYKELKVLDVKDTGEVEKKSGRHWFEIALEEGLTYKRPFLSAPAWIGKSRGFIITYKLDKDGNRKPDSPRISSPSVDDWGLRKLKTQKDIEGSKATVGEYIYNKLLSDPSQKIIGSYVQTIDRSLYRQELTAILNKQKEFIAELNDRQLYIQCIEELYPSNIPYRSSISNRDFTYLFVDDILFYQRPLKSKRSSIADCPYEKRMGKPIKCIAKSHPLYQEFRLWQFVCNLKLQKDGVDVTANVLSTHDDYVKLYDFLSERKSIKEEQLLKYFKIPKNELPHYSWNYVHDREYPCGETRAVLLGGLRKTGIGESFLYNLPSAPSASSRYPAGTYPNEMDLWHILYSVDDPTQYQKALCTFGKRHHWSDEQIANFVSAFKKLTVYKEKDYGAYSAKALTRMLPLMRRGEYWCEAAIDAATRERIEHIITGEADLSIKADIRERFTQLTSVEQCQGLNTWQACYLVYGRHSESADSKLWSTPEDIDAYLAEFRRNSLNNPIVEQVVLETLRVVRDIMSRYGRPDEIHLEMARELKKTAKAREELSQRITEGEATNQRIRVLLTEFMNPDCDIENVRPQSPSQQEILKIYEAGVLDRVNSSNDKAIDMPDDIKDISKRLSMSKNKPSHADVIKYKLWLDQKYISPYTGCPIPLAKLFTHDYQIEHVIPQSRYFDDSLSNKVICEAAVNKLKDRQLGFEFIRLHQGEKVPLGGDVSVRILDEEAYSKLVAQLFAKNPDKRRKLMLEDIPSDFNARQLTDTRYISRLMLHLLSNVVRKADAEGNAEDSVTVANVVPTNGAITDRLKHDWGINDVWNRIVLPRFERLNRLEQSQSYTAINSQGHLIPAMPLDMQQGFSKKRIDHRHHAMDAIVIACCSRSHVNLLNNESAQSSDARYDLQTKLRESEYYYDERGEKHRRFREFKKPWATFTEDVYATLQNIVVSFKQNLRVINKTSNRYTVITDGKHHLESQTKGDSWAIRKPLHQETIYGKVNLQLTKWVPIKRALSDVNHIVSRELKEKLKELKQRRYFDKQLIEYLEKNSDVWTEVKSGKVEVYYYTAAEGETYFAVRTPLISHFDKCNSPADAEKKIKSITDSGIRSILSAHLAAEGNNPTEAFSADGLERMNQNIKQLNGGKPHMPIKSVRVFEQASKFSIGNSGLKAKKYAEAAQGTNSFFVIFLNAKGERGFATVPLKVIIDLQKQYQKHWQEHLAERLVMGDLQLMSPCDKLLYVLSPNDLVYVPADNEQPSIDTLDKNRIYRVKSFTGNKFHCIPVFTANIILNKVEYEAQNKMETTIDKSQVIKKVCIPLKVNRLGEIISLG